MMNINQFLNIFMVVLLCYTIYIWYLLLTRKYYNKEEDYNDNIQLESYKRSLTKENLKVIDSMNGHTTLLYNLFFL